MCPVTESDFFRWYNDEITRYRNIEWKYAGWAIGFQYAMVHLATIHPASPWTRGFMAALILALGISLVAAEFHVHLRLNEYRAKQRALLGGDAGHGKQQGRLVGPAWDGAYFCGFVGFPVVLAILSVLYLLAYPR
jgi:hypothetical protein